jgi:tetratricopeptide (TPR) repeat protein
VAADVRRGGDGRSAARLKLVAGILGLPYDRLVQRDHQRSYRRVVAFAAAAVFALAVLATFTLVTLSSRREAEAQRGHAEGLVEFMLGDLRRKLEPEGKLATLDAVGKEALAYYAAQDPASLDADALARRARALHQIGEVADQRGQLDDALAVFRQAADSTAELLLREPDNPQRIFDHAQSFYWVGLIAHQRGQEGSAEAAFRDYKALADRLIAADPGNLKWQAEGSYADSNLGTLLFNRGSADEAAALFERALSAAQLVAAGDPHDLHNQFELAQSHAWLADARLEQGRLQDAIAQRESEIALYELILQTDSSNRDAREGLLVAETALGELSLLQGRVELAVLQMQRATTLAGDLIAADRENTTIIDYASRAEMMLAKAMKAAGDIGAAQSAAERARGLAASLVERDASFVTWQIRLGQGLLQQAALGSRGALDNLRTVQGVMQRLDALGTSARDNRQARLLYAQCLLMAADSHVVLGNPGEAARIWQEAASLINEDVPLKGPVAQALLFVTLGHLQRTAEARSVLARLRSVGYREPEFERLAESFTGENPARVAGTGIAGP